MGTFPRLFAYDIDSADSANVDDASFAADDDDGDEKTDGWKYRIIEQGAKLRTRFLGLPYGDQCIFVMSKSFSDIGGYREQLPLMEDADFATRSAEVTPPLRFCYQRLSSSIGFLRVSI